MSKYRAVARQFNPGNYDPKAWAALVKEAGMKYMIITAKFCDGFAMFPSAVTDWDIEEPSPYGKDIIAPLARAARDEGLIHERV